MPDTRELIHVQDDRGNTFQMTPQDAKLAGYQRVGASAEDAEDAGAASPNKGRKPAPNKKQTTSAQSGPSEGGMSGPDVVETASDGEQQSPQGESDHADSDQGDGA